MTKNKSTLTLVQGAALAALYAVLTILQNTLLPGSASMAVQFRIAETLTVFAVLTPAAIPGLFVGCILGNLLGGAIPLDVIFGSLATLIGALGTWAIGKKIRSAHLSKAVKYTLPIPPIAMNTIVVPLILYYGYGINIPIPIQMLTVGFGEILSCGVIGMILLFSLEKVGGKVFQPQEIEI